MSENPVDQADGTSVQRPSGSVDATGRRRRPWYRQGAALTAIISLLVAGGSLAYSVYRAGQEDRSELRTELSQVVQNLTGLEGSQKSGAVDERAALVVEGSQVLQKLGEQPSFYYRTLGAAYYSSLHYDASIAASGVALQRARAERDMPGQVYAERLIARVLGAEGKVQAMRRAYGQAVAIAERAWRAPAGSPDRIPGLVVGAYTLANWANDEANLGNCVAATDRLQAALALARSRPFTPAAFAEQVRTRGATASTCQAHGRVKAPPTA